MNLLKLASRRRECVGGDESLRLKFMTKLENKLCFNSINREQMLLIQGNKRKIPEITVTEEKVENR